MDALVITALIPVVSGHVNAFIRLISLKTIQGPNLNTNIEYIGYSSSAILSQLHEFEKLAKKDLESKQNPSMFDPNVSHLGAVLQLGMSGVSDIFGQLRIEAEKTTGVNQKVKFWSSKLKFYWNDARLKELLGRIRAISNIFNVLLDAMQYQYADPIDRVREVLLSRNGDIFRLLADSHDFRQEVLEKQKESLSAPNSTLALSQTEYQKLWTIVSLAADLKNVLNPQLTKRSMVPPKVGSASTQALFKDHTTSISAQSQSIASSSKQPIAQISELTISTSVENLKQDEQGNISPSDVEFYKVPTTSVETPESVESKRLSTQVSNATSDKVLLNAAGHGQTAIIKMMLDKGANINPDPKLSETPLFAAAVNGYLETLEVICDAVLMKDPYGLLATNAAGDTILHAACGGPGAFDMIDHLILHRSLGVEQAGAAGWRAIHYAAAKNNVPLVNHLIVKHGASPNAVCNEMYTPLHIAANRGYIEIIKVLLDHGADIHVWNIEDDQPIHSAALENQTAIVELLLERGARIDDTDNSTKPMTPVYCAIKSGKIDTLMLLLLRGADPTGNTQGGKGDQPIHWAAERGTEEQLVALLVRPGVKVDVASDHRGAGLLPIHHAAFSGNLAAMKLLISRGASVSSRGTLGTTPLDMAARWGHTPAVEYLIAAGADVNVRGENGVPTLHTAAIQNHFEVVKTLLEAGADPKALTKDGSHLAIHYAASGGDIPTTLLLLDAYPESLEITCSSDKKNYLTVLGMAACADHLPLVEALVARGADFECTGGNSLPTIQLAARNNLPTIIRALKEANADVNFMWEGWTPLMAAGEYSSVDAMQALIECGADIEMAEESANKGKAIHYAAAMKNPRPVECLVERGADIEAVMNRNERPLFLAAKYGHVETVKALLRLGADKEAVDDSGRTALDIAVVKGMVGVVELLI